MITLTALNKSYPTREGFTPVLREINLDVARGDIFGVIGHSGAGKSTLIRCINLLERPTSGSIIVDGQALMTLSPSALRQARRKIGMIFQHFNLLSSRTVFENVALPLELLGASSAHIKTKVAHLLALTGLSDKKNVYPRELSGGQKQRVAIARALAHDPKIVLSDEATSSLDPYTTHTILQLLKTLRDELSLTIVMITHEMEVIKSVCDRVAILSNGEIVEENEVGAFFSRQKTKLARDFVQSTVKQTLPQAIAEQLMMTDQAGTHPVMRLWFVGDAATQPIIAQLVMQFRLKINILQANVDYVKHHALGVMVIAANGEKAQLIAAQVYLKKIGVMVEVMGYVPNNIVSFA